MYPTNIEIKTKKELIGLSPTEVLYMEKKQDEISLNTIGLEKKNKRGCKIYTHNGPDILAINIK